MGIAKFRAIVGMFVFVFCVAVSAGQCEEGMDTQAPAPAPDAYMVQETTTEQSVAVPTDIYQPVVPAAEATAPAVTESTGGAAVQAPEPASDIYIPTAPAAEEPAAVLPAVPVVEEKKEEVKPVEKHNKKSKVSKLADLEIVKVVARKSGETDVELIVFIKNKGSKSAKAKDGGAISLAVRPEGAAATRMVKVSKEVKAGKKIEYSLGTYPRDTIEGKNIFITITCDGKEANKRNNFWNKPAKVLKK
jgi:hypothetical protein